MQVGNKQCFEQITCITCIMNYYSLFFLMKNTVLFPGDDLMRRAAKWRRSKMHVRFNCFAYKQMHAMFTYIVVYCITSTHMLSLPLLCVFYCVYIYLYTSASSKKGERSSFFHRPFWTMIFVIESSNRSKWQIFLFRFDF